MVVYCKDCIADWIESLVAAEGASVRIHQSRCSVSFLYCGLITDECVGEMCERCMEGVYVIVCVCVCVCVWFCNRE